MRILTPRILFDCLIDEQFGARKAYYPLWSPGGGETQMASGKSSVGPPSRLEALHARVHPGVDGCDETISRPLFFFLLNRLVGGPLGEPLVPSWLG
ncbi:hypothetical protein NPIL_375671 [Nephila pilipes]|uniref:Uncharacterized protein n=1 Tax=Nephila pilipes TaxID=299642 RepID=A0A8X6T510_NEPPI|nr:hypothetical protein NPIL_375671 [Nephila pilipes]